MNNRVATLADKIRIIADEWERQKRLFPELLRDGWMDKAINEATIATARFADEDLSSARMKAATNALESYNFGEGVTIEDGGFWDNTPNEWSQMLYVRFDDDAADQPTHRVNFHVSFETGTSELLEVYALAMDSGNKIGFMPAPAPEATPPQTMAERWVALYQEWQDLPREAPDFSEAPDFLEWLRARDLIGDDFHFISLWNLRPDPEKSTLDYAVMDFGDGSIALRRNHSLWEGDAGAERVWQCLPATTVSPEVLAAIAEVRQKLQLPAGMESMDGYLAQAIRSLTRNDLSRPRKTPLADGPG